MPAAHRIARRLLLLGVVAASITGACAAGTASAASPGAAGTSSGPAPLTVCPTLGTVAVTARTGAGTCVRNDCVSIAMATTGSAASCNSTTARNQSIMDVAPTPTPLVASPRSSGTAAPLAPAPSLSTTQIVIRSLVGIGIAALLLAGALALGGRRTRRRVEGASPRSTTAA